MSKLKYEDKINIYKERKNGITRYYNYKGVINVKHRNILILQTSL